MENVTDFVKPLHLGSVSGFVEYPCYDYFLLGTL